MGWLLVSKRTIPSSTYEKPRVVMKEPTCQYVTMAPMTSPTTMPIIKTMPMANHMFMPYSTMSFAARHPLRQAIPPWLRSISPPKTTNAAPNATTPVTHI